MGRGIATALVVVLAALLTSTSALARQGSTLEGDGDAPDPLSCQERVVIPQIGGAVEQRWAPDSRHLAVTSVVRGPSRKTVTGYEENPSISILDVTSGELRSLGAGSMPRWSATGRYLSMWREGHLLVVHAGAVVAEVLASMPEVRWVGDQLVYFAGDEIRGWTEADDVLIAAVAPEMTPSFPRDWVDFSADGVLFTLTRYHMDGAAERYVGQIANGQVAGLDTAGTTFTEWSPIGETLLVRSDDAVELRGPMGWRADQGVGAFAGRVHTWTADGRLLMGRMTPTTADDVAFDRLGVWSGATNAVVATLPNLLGSRSFSPDGAYFAGAARDGQSAFAVRVYRCGTSAPAASRAGPAARAHVASVTDEGHALVRPVPGYVSQFLQGAHTGVDVAAPFGSLITADADGDVTYVGWVPVGGRAVCVRHADELETCDYHTSLALVSVGQHVLRGEPIAAVGMTGVTTGPHVHWEAKLSGLIVDPLDR